MLQPFSGTITRYSHSFLLSAAYLHARLQVSTSPSVYVVYWVQISFKVVMMSNIFVVKLSAHDDCWNCSVLAVPLFVQRHQVVTLIKYSDVTG